MSLSFTSRVIEIIQQVPEGKVVTYGLIAVCAGNPRGARQVARILHSSSRKENLPWHRVVNRFGRISLSASQGYEIQKQLLQKEGIVFGGDDAIDLDRHLWHPPWGSGHAGSI